MGQAPFNSQAYFKAYFSTTKKADDQASLELARAWDAYDKTSIYSHLMAVYIVIHLL